MQGVIHFNMLVDINELLKEKGLDYTVHSVGGCASCGVKLECYGKEKPITEVVQVINEYLSQHFIVAVSNRYDPMTLNVVSKFDRL